MSPFLTVIIPAFNSEQTILRTLASLSRQPSDEIDVVLVDDGSTDGTLALVTQYAAQHPELAIRVVSQRNQGVSAARNAGLAASSGKYVLFLDADDEVDFNLTSALKAEAREEWNMICWQYATVSRNDSVSAKEASNPSGGQIFYGVEALRKMEVEGGLSVWMGSVAFLREWIGSLGLSFTVGCRSGEDREFIITALGRASRVAYVSQTLSYYQLTPGSATNRFSLARFDAIPALWRAAALLRPSGDTRLREIADHIACEGVTFHYFYHLSSNFLAGRYSMPQLLRLVERDYPGVNAAVRECLSRSPRLNFRRKLFLAWPRGYGLYLRLYQTRSRIQDLVKPKAGPRGSIVEGSVEGARLL